MLWGRNAERLENVAARARSYGVSVHTRVLDLSDGAAAIAALREDDDSHPLDIAILAAGLGDMRRGRDVVERAEDVLRLGLVNYATPSAMAAAAAERMARAGGAIS